MAKPKREKKWLLLQARIQFQLGRELKDLSAREGLPTSAYVRRLVLQHLDQMRALRPVGAASVTESPASSDSDDQPVAP